MNYDTIKQTAKDHGLKVSDLIALAPANDPFYTGRPSEVAGAEWFANLYRMFGYGGGVHLRRIHYRLVSQETPVLTPNGSTYENTQKSWGYLVNVSKWARYLDLVPGSDFVDRRNPDAIINTNWLQPGDWNWSDPSPSWDTEYGWDTWDYTDIPNVPEMDELSEVPEVADYKVSGYRGVQQDYHLELWSEKTTMNDILLPLCEQFGINLVTGAGELSITAVVDLLQRVETAGRPARILYISDYDPAGLGMPISVARKIEFYQRQFGYEHLDIRLQPLVLTREQVASFNLPQVPVKQSDKRKARFEREHGGATELDALEALHPGELATITRQAIVEYIDLSLPGRADEARRQLVLHLDDLREGVITHHAHDLALIENKYRGIQAEYEQTREDFALLASGFNSRLESHRQELAALSDEAKSAYSDVRDDMENEYVRMSDHPLPIPDIPVEQDVQLYMSDLGYVDQLERYKKYRSGIL